MTWKSFHNRGEVLRSVMAAADARRDGHLPMDVDGVAETFADELTLLGALQLRWHTRLAGHIERELMSEPMDLEAGVVAAWQATARELPGVRAIIDRHRQAPLDADMAAAMRVSAGKEHAMLAVMAGRSSASDELAASVGEQIADRARAALASTSAAASGPKHLSPAPASMVDRLKAVLTAA
ncbi:hypothetical protein [Nocardioides piscis]|uniref:Uncharacterized protein n=1 Tax=Nocardioides piscis TaxID=2714938 RepID=A0A6G7YBB4_9ACTN|nr:hypothetical protein [Nocardioides piscis]QIK74083.1 hypothetical protein G7071_00145 [Nocardioides piscis]